MVSPKPDFSAPTVVLPCPPDQFRDFIAGLLGKAQTIEASVPGPFAVTKNDVENLFHLLNQRVSSQNEATLVQFTAKVIYDDNSSVLLNSIGDFLAYNEVKPLISIAAHLNWTYLIKFPNKAYPEKQIVTVSFRGHETIDDIRSQGSIGMIYRRAFPIALQIEHTD